MPHPIPASSARSNRVALPQFPVAARDERSALYRHRAQRAMRLWVRFAFSDLASAPSDEIEAIDTACALARQELGRSILPVEALVIGEALRDVLTVQAITAAAEREDRIRGAEWLAEQQEGAHS